jgi:hypothetical protein
VGDLSAHARKSVGLPAPLASPWRHSAPTPIRQVTLNTGPKAGFSWMPGGQAEDRIGQALGSSLEHVVGWVGLNHPSPNLSVTFCARDCRTACRSRWARARPIPGIGSGRSDGVGCARWPLSARVGALLAITARAPCSLGKV